MKNIKTWLLLVALTTSVTAWANGSRTLDGALITNGAATLTLPTSTDTLVGRATTDTLTNKSISGATNTFSNIPVSAIATGTGLSVQSGGTGDTTLTVHGVLIGEGTSAVAVTSAPAQYQSLVGNASGDPSFQAISLNQSAAVSGQLATGNGGTGLNGITAHDLLVGNGSSAANLIAPSTAGFVLTSNGASADPSFQAVSSPAPSLNGGSGSAQSVTAAGGVSLASLTYQNFAWVAGSPGAVTVTATPSVSAGSADGQLLRIVGTNNTNTVTLQDQANLASSGLSLNGNWVGAKDSVLNLHWDATQSLWVEDARR